MMSQYVCCCQHPRPPAVACPISIVRDEGRLMKVGRWHESLVITFPKINFCKKFASCDSSRKVFHEVDRCLKKNRCLWAVSCCHRASRTYLVFLPGEEEMTMDCWPVDYSICRKSAVAAGRKLATPTLLQDVQLSTLLRQPWMTGNWGGDRNHLPTEDRNGKGS